jgi:pyridoxine 5-phosphate synthase
MVFVLLFCRPASRYDRRAKQTGTDRIELYTEAFAHEYGLGNKRIDPYVKAAILLMNWDWESMQDTI